MTFRKFAIAAFALSLTGAVAAGNTTGDKQKQAQPAGYSDQSQAATSKQGQKDTLAANKSSSSGATSGNGSSLSASSDSKSGNGASSFGASAGASSDPKIRQAQQALQQKGHDPGQIDGVMGPNTRQAIESFQQAQGIQASGQLDQRTLAALGVSGSAASGMSASRDSSQQGSSQQSSSMGQGSAQSAQSGQLSSGQASSGQQSSQQSGMSSSGQSASQSDTTSSRKY